MRIFTARWLAWLCCRTLPVALFAGLGTSVLAQTVLFSGKLTPVPDLIFTTAKIGDQDEEVVLDTGCGRLTFDRSLHHLVEPTAERQTLVSVFGQKFPSTLHRGPLVKVGGITYNRPLTLTINLESFWSVYGRKFRTVLSMDQLNHGVFRTDYERGVFELLSGSNYSPPAGYSAVKLSRSTDVPVFESSIEDQVIAFAVDTGDNGCITLERSAFAALVSKQVIRVRSLDSKAVVAGGNVLSERQGWFEKGELMGVQLKGVPVAESGISNLGQQWLYGFNIDLDFNRKQMHYIRRADNATPVATNLMLGALIIFKDGQAFVNSLRPGPGIGSAQAGGVEVGDVIIKVGKLNAEELNSASIARVVIESAGKKLTILIKPNGKGGEKAVELAVPDIIPGWKFPGLELWGGDS